MNDKVDVALLTTRRSDGHLVSRPMASQDRAPGADLWFVTGKDSGKLEEVLGDPHVNVTYYREKTREWVSVSGLAFVTDNRKMVRGSTSRTGKSTFRRKRAATDRPRIRASS